MFDSVSHSITHDALLYLSIQPGASFLRFCKALPVLLQDSLARPRLLTLDGLQRTATLHMHTQRERERERERERDRERERQRDRETERQRDKDRQTDTKTDRQTDRETQR